MTEEIRTQSDILKVAWISSNGFEKYSDFASEQTKWSVPPKIAGVTGYSWGGSSRNEGEQPVLTEHERQALF